MRTFAVLFVFLLGSVILAFSGYLIYYAAMHTTGDETNIPGWFGFLGVLVSLSLITAAHSDALKVAE